MSFPLISAHSALSCENTKRYLIPSLYFFFSSVQTQVSYIIIGMKINESS